LFNELGLGLDVTSEGEMYIARREEFDPQKIYVHGNNKTPDEIRAALHMSITHFVVDNRDEISTLASQVSNLQSPISPLQLLLRLSPNIDAHTHRYMTTGVADSKFGLGIQNGMAEEAAREILARAQAGANFELVGLHFHIGSQVFDTDALRDALYAVLDVAAEWQHRFGFQLRELNIGGGWGVAYNEAQ